MPASYQVTQFRNQFPAN